MSCLRCLCDREGRPALLIRMGYDSLLSSKVVRVLCLELTLVPVNRPGIAKRSVAMYRAIEICAYWVCFSLVAADRMRVAQLMVFSTGRRTTSADISAWLFSGSSWRVCIRRIVLP